MSEERKGLIDLVKKKAEHDKIMKGSEILKDAKDCNFIVAKKSIDDNTGVFRFKIVDIGNNFNVIIRQKSIIDTALYNIVEKVEYNHYRSTEGSANESLDHILLREGYPRLNKSKINIKVLRPGTGDPKYMLIGWSKEEPEFID